MAVNVHPTAIVESGAQLGADVEIGAYAFVGAGVTLGDKTRLHHHASVEGNTVLGGETPPGAPANDPFIYCGG